MKVAVVTPTILPFSEQRGIIGGGESYAYNLCAKLAEKGKKVTLFTRAANKTEEVNLNNSFTIKYMSSSPGLDVTSFSLTLYKEIVIGDFDIIHIHQLSTVNNVLTAALCRSKGTPVVLTDHGGGWALLSAISSLTAKLPDCFAAVSDFSATSLLQFAPRKKTAILYGGVDTKVFRIMENTPKTYDRITLKKSRMILFVGRLIPTKGVEYLIRSMAYLPSDVRLVIAGGIYDWEYYQYLRSQINAATKDRVDFLGLVSSTELPSIFNSCTLYTQPSVNIDYLGKKHRLPELFGLAKLEAMACAKPVVVTDVGGLPEKIVNGLNGYIVKPSDEHALAQAINAILSDDDHGREMGKNGLKTVLNDCTWEAVAQRAIQCYESLK